jgi:alkanesulfonate monooxygenase SsuD/methylene tetrahydromethanopterin reductase-like flavin-dependent oxidoreductase (luciferase family)
LWYPEVLSYESFGLGGFLLAHTKELIIASGIANIYARDAAATKQGQHTLAKLYGGRFLLGWESPMCRWSRMLVATSTVSL